MSLLPPRESVSLPISETSHIGEARRASARLAESLGFSETQQSNIAIIVTEAANNILRHAQSGEVLLRGLVEGDTGGMELLALDKGPGMSSVPQCLRDGFSTGGTSGNGLGAIKRLSHSLDFYTRPRSGTALCATVWAKPVMPTKKWDIGVVNRPKPGQDICGDSWSVEYHGAGAKMLVVDGLGHGPDAARASRDGVIAFEAFYTEAPGDILNRMHAALRGTRGAAAAAVHVDEKTQMLTFAGVGNIAGAVLTDDATTNMMSHHGIVGYQVRKIQEFTYPCAASSVVILSSDGIATLGASSTYPGLLNQPASLIAGVLYRDFQRVTDDTTILVAKMTGTAA